MDAEDQHNSQHTRTERQLEALTKLTSDFRDLNDLPSSHNLLASILDVQRSLLAQLQEALMDKPDRFELFELSQVL